VAGNTRHQFSGSLFVFTDLKLGRSPIPLLLTLAVLPSMSLTPSAPFADLRAVSHHDLRRTTNHRDLALDPPDHTRRDSHGELSSISPSTCRA
jgi:hypothetical protein